MTVTLAMLEQFLTDDVDELERRGWPSTASTEAFAVLYIAARQGEIKAVDLLFVATRCDLMTSFLIKRVLTRDDIPAAQEIINRIGEKKFSPE